MPSLNPKKQSLLPGTRTHRGQISERARSSTTNELLDKYWVEMQHVLLWKILFMAMNESTKISSCWERVHIQWMGFSSFQVLPWAGLAALTMRHGTESCFLRLRGFSSLHLGRKPHTHLNLLLCTDLSETINLKGSHLKNLFRFFNQYHPSMPAFYSWSKGSLSREEGKYFAMKETFSFQGAFGELPEVKPRQQSRG